MPDAPPAELKSPRLLAGPLAVSSGRDGSSTSFCELWANLVRRRRFIACVTGGLLLACLLYCLIVPNEYEASATVALRAAPATTLSLDGLSEGSSGSFASGQTQLETLANVFRSDQLAWRVIVDERLSDAPAFMGRFPRHFAAFRPDAPGPDAEAYLLDRFKRRLIVQTVPRTLILQIRFRSNDAALSAAVVNELIRAYNREDTEMRVEATAEATNWLENQLQVLKARVEQDDERLLQFQKQHGLLDTPDTLANGQPGDTATHDSTPGD